MWNKRSERIGVRGGEEVEVAKSCVVRALFWYFA